MIEDLADPLIHLIRNAVDHGVESAEERRRPASR
jgi:two-component system chemotaxis sensor kinase CheA